MTTTPPLRTFHSYEPRSGHGLPHDPFNAIVGPRPIGWISTQNAAGALNLAPYSFFNAFNYVPPIVGFGSIGTKDTLRNIEATGEFVVNVVTEELAQAMVDSARDYPPEVSEVTETGLHLLPSELVGVPRLAESPIQMECRLEQITEFGASPHSLIIGRVVLFHVQDALYSAGRIQADAWNPLGRMAGDWYCSTRDRIKIKRQDTHRDG